jgi:hypothetical protein
VLHDKTTHPSFWIVRDRDFFLSDFGNNVKVEVICTIEHSLSLAVVAERLKRADVEGIHRVA